MDHLHDRVFKLVQTEKAPRHGLLNLSSNELLHHKHDVIMRDCIRELSALDLTRYPTYESLRDELARYFHLTPANLLVAAGSDDAIKSVTEALATKSRRILLQYPNYEGWERYAKLRGVRVAPIPFGEPIPCRFTLEATLSAIDRQPPSLVVLSNPNGPTGFTFSSAEMDVVAERCAKRRHVLAIDACYAAFASQRPAELVHRFPETVVIQSLSKSFGIPGGRIAVICGSALLIDYLSRWQLQNAVSGVTSTIVMNLLSREAAIDSVRSDLLATREWFADQLLSLFTTWRALPTGGNFQCFRLRDNHEASLLTSYLLDRGIRIKNASGLFGMSATVRFTTGDQSTMSRVLNCLSDFR